MAPLILGNYQIINSMIMVGGISTGPSHDLGNLKRPLYYPEAPMGFLLGLDMLRWKGLLVFRV